jgi:hypothetical protein
MWTVRRITCVRTSGTGLRDATVVVEPGDDRNEKPAAPAAMTAAVAPSSRVCVLRMCGPPLVGVDGHSARAMSATSQALAKVWQTPSGS